MSTPDEDYELVCDWCHRSMVKIPARGCVNPEHHHAAGWCKGGGRGANYDGGCTFCSFVGKPTKHWVVRPHLIRGAA